MNQNNKIIRFQPMSGLVLLLALAFTNCMSQANGTKQIESSPIAPPRAETSTSPADKFDQSLYLLVFRAYPPHEKKERHLYDLAQEIKGFVDSGFPPSGIVTNDTVRYGVFTVQPAKVLKNTDSVQSPKSIKDGVYFLSYDRTYKICVKNYIISSKKIIYTDYQDGRKYEFPVKKSEPFSIFELEVSPENILRELWEEKQKGQ